MNLVEREHTGWFGRQGKGKDQEHQERGEWRLQEFGVECAKGTAGRDTPRGLSVAFLLKLWSRTYCEESNLLFFLLFLLFILPPPPPSCLFLFYRLRFLLFLSPLPFIIPLSWSLSHPALPLVFQFFFSLLHLFVFIVFILSFFCARPSLLPRSLISIFAVPVFFCHCSKLSSSSIILSILFFLFYLLSF